MQSVDSENNIPSIRSLDSLKYASSPRKSEANSKGSSILKLVIEKSANKLTDVNYDKKLKELIFDSECE